MEDKGKKITQGMRDSGDPLFAYPTRGGRLARHEPQSLPAPRAALLAMCLFGAVAVVPARGSGAMVREGGLRARPKVSD